MWSFGPLLSGGFETMNVLLRPIVLLDFMEIQSWMKTIKVTKMWYSQNRRPVSVPWYSWQLSVLYNCMGVCRNWFILARGTWGLNILEFWNKLFNWLQLKIALDEGVCTKEVGSQHRAVPAFQRNCSPHTAFSSFCSHETHVPILQETAIFFGTSLVTSVQLFLPELVNHPSPPIGAPSVLVSTSLFLLFG